MDPDSLENSDSPCGQGSNGEMPGPCGSTLENLVSGDKGDRRSGPVLVQQLPGIGGDFNAGRTASCNQNSCYPFGALTQDEVASLVEIEDGLYGKNMFIGSSDLCGGHHAADVKRCYIIWYLHIVVQIELVGHRINRCDSGLDELTAAILDHSLDVEADLPGFVKAGKHARPHTRVVMITAGAD